MHANRLRSLCTEIFRIANWLNPEFKHNFSKEEPVAAVWAKPNNPLFTLGRHDHFAWFARQNKISGKFESIQKIK